MYTPEKPVDCSSAGYYWDAAEVTSPEKIALRLAYEICSDYQRRYPGSNLQPRVDIAECFGDFTQERVHSSAVLPCMLVDLFDRLNDEISRKNVMRSLQILQRDRSMLAGSNDQITHEEYTLSIGHDIPLVNDLISRQIDGWRASLRQTGRSEDREIQYALDAPKEFVPPSYVFLANEMPFDKHALAELMEEINIESILMKAVQALIVLRDKEAVAAMSPTEMLRLIAATEAIYAPLSELPTYEPVAACLLSGTYCLRYEMAGCSEFIDQARSILHEAGSPEIISAEVGHIIGSLCGKDFFTTPVIRNGVEKYGLMFEHGLVKIGEHDRYLRIRQKTEGSIARKLRHYTQKPEIYQSDAKPNDIIGITIMVDSPDEVGPVLAEIYSKVEGHPSAQLTTSPGRSSELHIKGSDTYREQVVDALEANGRPRDTIDLKRSMNDFQYSKVTLAWTYEGVDGIHHTAPVEIQVMDAGAYAASRYGHGNHSDFKVEKYNDRLVSTRFGEVLDDTLGESVHPSPTNALYTIHTRHEKVSPRECTVNGQSYRRYIETTAVFTRAEEINRRQGQVGSAL